MNTIIDTLIIFGIVSTITLVVGAITTLVKIILERIFHINVMEILTSDDKELTNNQ